MIVPPDITLQLALFASGLTQPVGVYNDGTGDDRLFVIERTGVIRIVRANGTVEPTPFLDISGRVDSSDGEEGLLGLTFHHDYATTGFFYVNYINTTGGIRRTRISRFAVTGNPDVADPNSEVILLTVTQPASNHNAGDLHFGLDDLLYIPLGDGGGSSNTAQDPTTLLGKVIRIDVDLSDGTADCVGDEGGGDYAVPATNPAVDGVGMDSCDEIWATGFRNPWRSSFDRVTGDFWIGDVGQNNWEEITLHPDGTPGGRNYGWDCYEGTHAFDLTGCGLAGDYTEPIFEYSHAGVHCTVVGGYVYRGTIYDVFMEGRYIFADFCSGNFWDLAPDGMGGWRVAQHTNLSTSGFVSFGEDADGELYAVNINSGELYRVVAS